jgi:ABC-2 type transport system ATP-binding protein
VNRDLLIETKDLTKRYGSRIVAVDGLSLKVKRGEVYGFLGPNGAGKTTTLRMLLGLIYPTSGTATVLDEAPGAPAGLSRVGALVESPTFYPYLSGRDNLTGMARLSGIRDPKGRVETVLKQVGLEQRGRDKFKKYSLGMKQRLGVAAALLKDPELLILDEPTNGLDPKGVAEMRDLIRFLGRGGRTVLLSSHLMGEVEQICDRVGVILRGKLVAESSVNELRGKGGLLVKAEPVEQAAQIARRIRGVGEVAVNDGALRLTTGPEHAPEVARELVSAGVRIKEIRPAQRSLEEAFFELTETEEVG